MFKKFRDQNQPFQIDIKEKNPGFELLIEPADDQSIPFPIERFQVLDEKKFEIQSRGQRLKGTYQIAEGIYFLHLDGHTYKFYETSEQSQDAGGGAHRSPMPGKVLSLKVSIGDQVTAGSTLAVVEAMKMENAIKASQDGIVTTIGCEIGQLVTPEMILIEIEA